MVTETLIGVLSNLLKKIVNDIDSGNSNLTENECVEIINTIKGLTDKTDRISKYEACKYLNISRATFDNYVREGKLPRGKHKAGFKELSWEKKELEEFVKLHRTH